jgi:hypothetical protein
MLRASKNGWILETSHLLHDSSLTKPYRAWVSNAARAICGYNSGATEAEAVRNALQVAVANGQPADAIAALGAEYVG